MTPPKIKLGIGVLFWGPRATLWGQHWFSWQPLRSVRAEEMSPISGSLAPGKTKCWQRKGGGGKGGRGKGMGSQRPWGWRNGRTEVIPGRLRGAGCAGWGAVEQVADVGVSSGVARPGEGGRSGDGVAVVPRLPFPGETPGPAASPPAFSSALKWGAEPAENRAVEPPQLSGVWSRQTWPPGASGVKAQRRRGWGLGPRVPGGWRAESEAASPVCPGAGWKVVQEGVVAFGGSGQGS